MKRVQPIRDLEALAAMKDILRHQSPRDHMLFLLGCNTALRVGDLLALTVADVRDETGAIREYITVTQEKTGKTHRFKLPATVRQELAGYTQGTDGTLPLFPSRQGSAALSRGQAWRIISEAAQQAGIDSIGTHSMRKSWGYHAYKRTKDIAVVQHNLDHSSERETKRYLGIDDDEAEAALEGFEL